MQGTAETLSNEQLIKTGNKVGPSKATLAYVQYRPVLLWAMLQKVFCSGTSMTPKCLTYRKNFAHFLHGACSVARSTCELVTPVLHVCTVYRQWMGAGAGFVDEG